MRIEGHVGPSVGIDGQEGLSLRQGKTSELIATRLHGRYYETVSRGNVFYGTTAALSIVALASATANKPTLMNQPGSNVNCSLLRITLTYTSTTTVVGGLHLAYNNNVGVPATGAPIATFTNIAPVNALIGSQIAPKARFGQTNTWNVAPANMGMVGIGEVAMTNAAVNNPFILVVDYDGLVVLAPGNSLSLCATTATGATYIVTFIWEEIPIMGGV